VEKSELLHQLASAEQDVVDGERHLARQRDVLDLLRAGRRDTTDAEALLADFECLQACAISNRDQIRAELEACPADPQSGRDG
jgi:hypothetical protein